MIKALSAAIFAGFILTANTHATLIDVYQGLPGPGAYKGTIEAFSGLDPAAVNYDYFSHSGHPIEGPNLKYNRGEIFFYDGPEGTTFNVLFNKEKKPGDPNTYGLVSWNLGVGTFGAPSVLLSDDRRELKQDDIDPEFFKGRWEWSNNTDGGIIQGLEGPIWAVVIDPKEYQGIDALKVFSANGERINMNLHTGARGNMFFVLHVPEGGNALYLLSAGMTGLVVTFRRKRTS